MPLYFCRNTKSIKPQSLIIDDIIATGATRRRYKDNIFVAIHSKLSKEELKENTNLTIALHFISKDTWVVYPWEVRDEGNGPTEHVKRLIEFIGEDPNRDGLRDTPSRVIKSYSELFSGYNNKLDFSTSIFDAPSKEIITLKDIEIYSMCEHHLLPFIGKAHIGYLPNSKIIGISKLARIADHFSRRLQIQENLTNQITNFIYESIEPEGVGCVIEAEHLCMRMRGVGKQNSIMKTSSLLGSFREDQRTRAEFLSLIK
jgi:GTP cyclohydrolase I